MTSKDKLFLKLFGSERKRNIFVPLIAILFSILTGSVVILLAGKNPIAAYSSLLQGSGILPKASYAGGTNQLTDLTGFLDILAPMIFASLAVIVALKAGLFNIGVSGQMLLGGFIASITAGYTVAPAPISKILVLLIGILIGAIVGAFIGFLKFKFNINEVVSCIMINYIISYITSYFINLYYLNPLSRQSEYILPNAALTIKGMNLNGAKVDFPIAIILAIITAFLVHAMLEKTSLGYEIKAVGANRNAAKYAGMNVGKTMITTMAISGALAGLAGVSLYLGYFTSIQPKVLSSIGFDAIATALLANVNSLAAIAASFLVTIFSKGAVYMSSKAGVVKELSGVVTSLILVFAAIATYFKILLAKKVENINSKNGGKKSE